MLNSWRKSCRAFGPSWSGRRLKQCGRKVLLALTVLFAAVPFTTSIAVAQQSLIPSAPFEAVDRFGVELSSGTVQVSSPSISVGPADCGLSFAATWDTGVHAWRYSNWGAVNKPVGSDPYCYNYLTVSFMGKSSKFQRDTCTGPYILMDGLGTLTGASGTWTYTAPDGTIGTYQGTSRVVVGGALVDQTKIVSIAKPTGEIVTFTYASGGLQSVANNFGYQIHFEYVSSVLSKVTALNNAVDPCDPTAASCTYSVTWPSLTFTTSGVEQQVTDALSRTTRVIFDSTTPSTAKIVGMARPTRTSGASVTYTNTFVPPLGWRVTAASDGVGTWTYNYEGWPCPPTGPCPPPTENYDLDTTITDPNAGTTVYNIRWDYEGEFSNGQVLSSLASVTNQLGQTTGLGFDGSGFVAASYPEGNGVYITRSYVTSAVETITEYAKPGSGIADAVTTFNYPDCSLTTAILCRRPTSVSDARGNVMTYTYDAAGNVLTETSPVPTFGAVQPQTRSVYQQQNAWYKQGGSSSITQNTSPVWLRVEQSQCATLTGQVGSTPALCDGTADEILSTIGYQAGGSGAASNLLPVTVSSGAGDASLTATTTTAYDGTSNVLTVNGPLAGTADTTRYVYDVMLQSVGVIGPDPDAGGGRLFPATRNTYNADGQTTVVERGTTNGQTDPDWSAFSALQAATTTYDAQGRTSREQGAPGTAAASLTDYAYDTAGRLICTAQRMNPANFGASATNACSLTTAGAYGPDRIVRNTYDAADRLTQAQTGYATSAVLTERVQAWTSNGKTDWIEDGAGNRSASAYDGMDRLYRMYFPVTAVGSHVANASDFEEYGYDANDNPTSKRTRANTLFTTTFDTLNRIASIDAPSGSNDVWYSYDNLSRRLSASHASGAPNCSTTAVCSTWDALSRQITETTSLGTMTRGYDLAGRRIQLTWPDLFFVTYAYDLDDQMVLMRQAGVTDIAAYAYDNLGRRTSTGRGNAVSTFYGYDAASRLTSLSHDIAGTGSDVTYAYAHNPGSQITSLGRSNSAYAYAGPTGSATYTNNGLNQSVSAAGATLTWSTQGNLIGDGTRTYTYDSASRLTGVGSSTLSYDPLDRLSQMVGTQGARYLYDGSQITGVISASSGTAINNRLVRGPWPDELVVAYQGTTASTPLWTLQDHQSSSIAITDASGAALYTLAYDEYGNPRPGNAGRLMYTGQLWMPDFAAYHYKARVYRPDLGRFLQTDPVGYAQGLNLYAYVGNDPVNRTDPTGKQSWLVSRPTGWGDTDHMFVVVAPVPGGDMKAQFSYGPSEGVGGQLTNQPQNSSIYQTDNAAWATLSDPSSAQEAGVSFRQINASDASVIATGENVSARLGTPAAPGPVPYSAVPTWGSAANSNSAAYAVANGATQADNATASAQRLPAGAQAPGWGHADRVLPGTGAPIDPSAGCRSVGKC